MRKGTRLETGRRGLRPADRGIGTAIALIPTASEGGAGTALAFSAIEGSVNTRIGRLMAPVAAALRSMAAEGRIDGVRRRFIAEWLGGGEG